jgi:hypothetical protein
MSELKETPKRGMKAYQPPTLRRFGDIQGITAANRGGKVADGANRDPGSRTGT